MAKWRERERERERGFDIYWANSPDSLVLTNATEFRERQRKGADRDGPCLQYCKSKCLH